jgi:NitT/TauT family transport system substrate-binding protein
VNGSDGTSQGGNVTHVRVAVRRATHTLRAGILQLLLVSGVAGCVAEPEATLRLGTNVWPGYAPLYLAHALHPADTQPLHLVEYQSSTEVLRAFRNNAIDAAALTLDEAVLLAESGEDPRILLVLDVSMGADALIARGAVKNLRDIKGRRVGVENGASGAYMLSRALQVAGLGLQDVNVVPLTVAEHEDAFARGAVDAVITFEPVRTRLLARGGRSLFDSEQIPGEIVDVLVVRKSFLDRHPAVVQKLLRAWFHSLDHYRTQPAAALPYMAAFLGLTQTDTQRALAGMHLPDLKENLAMLAGTPPTLRAPAERLGALMLQQRLLHRPVESAGLFSPATLESLAP